MPRASRVLVVGWNSADWDILHPLLDSGQLPHLQHLIDHGSMGTLIAPQPPVPIVVWTSLATGCHADRHGILGPMEIEPDAGGVRPTMLHSRRRPALWDIAKAHGLRTHVIGWPGSVQAEPVNGVFVTPAFAAATNEVDWPLTPGSIAPPELETTLAELRLGPNQVPPAALKELLPLAHKIDQRYDDRLARAAMGLALACSMHNAATWALANKEWEFAAIQYDALGYFARHFSEYHPPCMAHVAPAEFEVYQGLLAAAYRFHDMLLGTLLDLAGPGTATVVVSPHGYSSGSRRPRHNTTAFTDPRAWFAPYGVLCLHGPGIRSDELLHGPRVVDVAPTVLRLLGLDAAAAQMDGQPLAAAFYQSLTAFQVASSPIAALEPIAAQGLADQFLAMAQSDAISPALQPVAEDIQFNLIGVYMSTGRPAQALPLIETLAANAPEEIRFQRTLAQCYLAVGRLEDAELLLDRLVAGHESHPWVYFLRGVIYMHRKEADRALADFQHAAQLGEDCASLHAFIGNVYLSKRMWVEAEAAHTKALQLDSESPEALSGMAALRLHEQDEEPAIGFLLQAIGVRYEMPFAHYQLGMALARIGQWDRAAVAFRAALALAPGMKNAARYLKFVEAHINPLFRPGKH